MGINTKFTMLEQHSEGTKSSLNLWEIGLHKTTLWLTNSTERCPGWSKQQLRLTNRDLLQLQCSSKLKMISKRSSAPMQLSLRRSSRKMQKSIESSLLIRTLGLLWKNKGCLSMSSDPKWMTTDGEGCSSSPTSFKYFCKRYTLHHPNPGDSEALKILSSIGTVR